MSNLIFLSPPKKYFLYAHSSHRLITENLRTTPGRKNFKIVKQLSAGKKRGGSKIIEEATINFNATTNVTVLVSNS